MTREPMSNPAHGGNSFEKEFDPLSETLNLPVNQDDTATEIELAPVPAAGERISNREPHVGLRRVTVTLSDEPWLASRAEPLDRELHKLPLLNHSGIVRIRAVARTTTGWLIDFDHQTQVALSRLTKRHAASLFSAITGVTEPSASVVDQLIAATDGIPLFVEGFARAWPRAETEQARGQVF